MACLTNYTVQCRDVVSGVTGCFFFDTDHWQRTGEFKAIGPVYPDLVSFYNATDMDDRKAVHLERITDNA